MEEQFTSFENKAMHSPSLKHHFKTVNTVEKILNTVHEMFHDRGYTILQKTKWSKNNLQFDDLKIVAQKPSQVLDPPPLVHVYFVPDPKVPVKKMREYIANMTECKVNHAIIVYAQQITPSAKDEIPPNLEIETFKASELFENVTNNLTT